MWRYTVQDADPRSLIAAGVLVVAAVFAYFNRRKVLDANLNLFAELLHGQISFPLLGLPVYAIVVGEYKGRTVTCRWTPLTRRRDVSLHIEPLGLPRSSGWMLKNNGEPTEYTYMLGNRIYYWGPSGAFIGTEQYRRPHLPGTLLKRLSRSDAVFFLEHLVEAAELVEKGSAHNVLQP